MPTPSARTSHLSPPSVPDDFSARTTCPPEDERLSAWSHSLDLPATDDSDTPDNPLSPASDNAHVQARSDDDIAQSTSDLAKLQTTPTPSISKMPKSEEDPVVGRLSPSGGPLRSSPQSSSLTSPSTTSLLSYEFSNVRLLPSHSSYLRAGSKFVGTQQSDRQVYNVEVEIKHVDMAESYLCGYLRIQGLTQDHPTLTTFFEGEIIGTKYTFKTRNETWGATEKTDMSHWSRFDAWRPLAKQAKRPDFTYRNFSQREHIFMRWKEHFLVPDHQVRTISGASFEGFYYICFNQVHGTVSGIYFHAKSEKYQQLELTHVEDHGCAPAVEFR